MHPNFAEREELKNVGCIAYIQTKDVFFEPVFFVIAGPVQRVAELKALLESGAEATVSHYAVILARGYGTPNEHDKALLRAEWDIDFDAELASAQRDGRVTTGASAPLSEKVVQALEALHKDAMQSGGE